MKIHMYLGSHAIICMVMAYIVVTLYVAQGKSYTAILHTPFQSNLLYILQVYSVGRVTNEERYNINLFECNGYGP